MLLERIQLGELNTPLETITDIAHTTNKKTLISELSTPLEATFI